MKNMELELRGEISKSKFADVLKKLKKGGKLIDKNKRLSFMCFGRMGDIDLDIRG